MLWKGCLEVVPAYVFEDAVTKTGKDYLMLFIYILLVMCLSSKADHITVLSTSVYPPDFIKCICLKTFTCSYNKTKVCSALIQAEKDAHAFTGLALISTIHQNSLEIYPVQSTTPCWEYF